MNLALKELYKSILTKRYYKKEITRAGNKIRVNVYQRRFLTIHTFYIENEAISGQKIRYTMNCGTVIADNDCLLNIVAKQ